MANNKTDAQIIGEYLPKIKAFADTAMFAENAERIYNFLKPYHYDTSGWLLYGAAKGILQADVYSEFPAEDNMGYFEILDGYGLLKWLEIAKFAEKEYEQIRGGYELLKSHTLDENSPQYTEYRNKLHTAAVKSIIIDLTNNQPYLLPGFWARLSNMENIITNGLLTKDDINDILDSEVNSLHDFTKEKAEGQKHSEYEVKNAIRNALYSTPLFDEQIQALSVIPNILNDAYNFYLEKGKEGKFFDTAFAYLEKAEHDYHAGLLFDRVKTEYNEYIDEVKKLPPEKIIDEAYKLTIMYDLHISLEPETSNYSNEQLKALISLDSPLWSLYQEWQRRDWTYMDDVKDVITETANEKASENEDNSFEPDNDLENEDGQEI